MYSTKIFSDFHTLPKAHETHSQNNKYVFSLNHKGRAVNGTEGLGDSDRGEGRLGTERDTWGAGASETLCGGGGGAGTTSAH